ncbi:MAG: LlaJI family restriction endonuclease [Oscillospiraceae bacterium]
MDMQKSIRERCHVNTNYEGDSFVGVRADTDDAMIFFPIGYQLPPNDDDLRGDINNLLNVLAAFMKEEALIEESKSAEQKKVDFPMHAYLKVIRDFLRTGRYYIETEPKYKTDTKGNASWPRTIREQKALVQKNGSLIFTNMTVRSVTPNADKKITQIHRYCVYEAFDKIGWLYVPYMPEKPGPHPDIREAVYILENKLASTHNDVEQELFSAMVSMLTYMDERSSEKQYFYGTDYFERIWEKMIDRAFGVADKEQYFPRTRWLLDYGPDKTKKPLQPDTVMIYNDKVYVLDAKLYRYGCSGDPKHLPNGSDISKQITYGEYIERAKSVSSDKLYNAFIMPFNREDNKFFEIGPNGEHIPCVTENFGNIGEAVGDWKPDPKKYERVQGIVVDTRFLMYNYIEISDEQKRSLAEAIEKVDSRGPVPKPTA